MSELGQKRKCPDSRGTSVLPSGPDIVSLPQHVRLVPFAEVAASFDYLVGAAEQRKWDGETERLCGFEVYNQLDLRRLHDRQVSPLSTFPA
jgi:hypothetical protein